jgi:hypothetical protein
MTDQAMSPLRRRMIEDMTIRKFAPKKRRLSNVFGMLASPRVLDVSLLAANRRFGQVAVDGVALDVIQASKTGVLNHARRGYQSAP